LAGLVAAIPKLAPVGCSAFRRAVLFWLKKFITFWLMPLPFCVTAMVIGLVLMRWPKRARVGRALLTMGVLLLVLFSNKFVSKWLIRPIEARYPAMPEFSADAALPADLAACRFVVVLGGGNGESPGMSANNLLSASALARIMEAVRILRVLPAAKLIVSGPGGEDHASHAVVLARAAQAYGITSDRILYIDQARDTEEEAHAVHKLAAGARVALVTSAWHMPRSVALCRAVGVNVLPCPADFKSHRRDRVDFDDFLWEVSSLERSTVAIRERIGYLWIWLRGKS
jgi:uncharacterized SAM-binding protein YcdF (DUF218 family)